METVLWILLWGCWGYYVLYAVIGAIQYYKENNKK